MDYVAANMDRFKIIFENKNLSKGLLFSLLLERGQSRPSEEILSFLKEFFFGTLQELRTADEIEEGELVRVSKLLIKYFNRLSVSEK